jgi:phosphoribosylanthranilate isomerase
MKIKICGMRDRQNIIDLADLHPHYMGFIFYDASPRFVGHDFVMPLLPESTIKVGVWVNEAHTEILSTAEKHQLEAVQLHGNESPATCAAIHEQGYTVIKAFSIDEDFDFGFTKDYTSVVDYFLFDTKGQYFGGNAKSFNWDLLKNYTYSRPYFLSGGINNQNIDKALKLRDQRLHALDLNSGLEISPGFKDLVFAKEAIDKMNKHINV